MTTISLCMIVKNEEDVIARCLESVSELVDEIIIVDTGSTDKTKEIVKKFNSKVYDFKWIDDFSAARNFSFSKATKEYIFWLDADDVLLEEDREKFKHLKAALEPSVDIVMMKYNYAFDEYGNVTLSHFRERLSKRTKKFRWIDPIHEYLEYTGNIINSDICITHKRVHNAADRNLKIFESMLSKRREFSPRNLFYFAKELYYNGRYDDAITYFNKFLDTGKGWVEDNISTCYELSKCYFYKNEKENVLKILLRSFEYDTPRAEICCQLGYYYMETSDYNKAIFWYELAERLKKPENCWGFISNDSWGYLPCIQLCVCYYRLGNIEESKRYNGMAAEYKPDSPAVLYNKKFFDELCW